LAVAFALPIGTAVAQTPPAPAPNDPRSQAEILTDLRGLFGGEDVSFFLLKTSTKGRAVDGQLTNLDGDHISIFIRGGVWFRCDLRQLGEVIVHQGAGLFASDSELTFGCAETGSALRFFSRDGRVLGRIKRDLDILAARLPPATSSPVTTPSAASP
jgi:hypothetical protein